MNAPKTAGMRTRLPQDSVPRSPHRWGVVLAGGDGLRLRALTRLICQDDRPKQFCPLLGEHTLLKQARQRAEKSVKHDQVLFVVTREHRDYYLRDLADCPRQRIVQPCNKGTAPAILCSLLHVAQMDPEAIVAILPSDHYYSEERLFTGILDSAFEIAGARPGSIVLLGAQPSSPEVGYGWIEVGAALRGTMTGSFRVKGFQEKPPLQIAERFIKKGWLWNMFVMIGHVRAFLEVAWATVPGLMQELRSAGTVPHAGRDTQIDDSLYQRIAPTDFSRQILSQGVSRLVTLPLRNVEWSDLGDPDRVLATILQEGIELPWWFRLWRAASASAPISSSAVA